MKRKIQNGLGKAKDFYYENAEAISKCMILIGYGMIVGGFFYTFGVFNSVSYIMKGVDVVLTKYPDKTMKELDDMCRQGINVFE